MLADKYQQQYDILRDRYTLPATPIFVFSSLDSTNKKAWELMAQNPLPIAITAIEQTAGKGQWGKTWESSPGGLYLSVAMVTDMALEDNYSLVMATAVGITTLLRHYDVPVSLKWSNDLILAGRKLGGIKIETKTRGDRIQQAVVGVGLNWENITPEIGIALKEYNQKNSLPITSLEQLNAIAVAGIIQGYQNLFQQGIELVYQQYQKLLNSIGRQVTIEANSGIVTGVTPQGKLEVSLTSPGAKSRIYFVPGDISLGYQDVSD